MKTRIALGLCLVIGISLAAWALFLEPRFEQGVFVFESEDAGEQRFQEGWLIYDLTFKVPFESLKEVAPEVYALYAAPEKDVSVDMFDVNDDGAVEILIYDNVLTPTPPVESLNYHAVRVYGQDTSGAWKELVSQPERFVIQDHPDYSPKKISIVRSPWGDYALANNDLRNFYEWRGTHFDSLPAGYGSYEAWLERREKEYEERISPLTFSEEVLGARKRIVSDHYGLSFEVPTAWKVEGKLIHPYIWSLPYGDGLGAATFKAYSTNERYQGSWGHGHALRSDVDGSQASFDMLRAQPDGYATKEETDRQRSEYQKVGNLTVSGLPAVRVRYWGGIFNSDGIWDDDILWIKDGEMNWYVVSDHFYGAELDSQYEEVLRSLQVLR